MNQETSYPKTLPEAVERLFKELSQEEKENLKGVKENQLHDMHFALGAYIRNTMGLYRGNYALMKDCNSREADTCSGLIIRALWERLREDVDVEEWLRKK